ncbi:hypothetical protein BDW75DRAFT_230622 [Aspergillus navahoensis]
MSAPTANPVGPGTLITVKVTYEDHTRRFKIPLRDLGARTLPQNLRQLLGTPADTNVIFERYSDSAGSYVQLDSNNPAVFKQLYRAAKAKLKLRIKATVVQPMSQPAVSESSSEPHNLARYSYLDTVLSHPIPEKCGTDHVVRDSKPLLLYYRNGNNPSSPVISHTSAAGVFCIDCDHCGRPIPNEHYHCNTCSDGDYDLCPQCIDSGVNCQGEDHWLVRRFVKDGIITNSTTKTLASHKIRTRDEHELQPELVLESAPEPTEKITVSHKRICNNCLKEFDEDKMVSCADCDDFDLCITCILGHKHGHHPSHTFVLLGDHDNSLKNLVLSRCKPGRGYHHAAICDGCESHITGVRHKCLTCPDWDYCSECHLSASRTHPGHRFAPLYTAISEPLQSHEVHFGVFCDGPLCKDKPRSGYITGVRYKCSVCHDTDFCAKCEVHPSNTHNRTHPMVMLKTPVRSVTVNTVHENTFNQETSSVGDHTQRSTSTQAPAPVGPDTDMEMVAEKEVQLPEDSAEKEKSITPEKTSSPVTESEYQAFFLEDTISDGTAMQPNQVFQQTWKLYNPGPLAWPAGSNVRFVGGDSMFNVDTNHPSSLASVTAAMESNKLTHPLEAGQSAQFTVSLKAPRRLGSAISYWRMKLADGTPFGHRLWCDIQVREDLTSATDDSKDDSNITSNGKAPGAAAVDNSDISESQMVFPKLDKESPAASTHEAVDMPANAPSVTDASERDVLDDVASLTLDEETSTEAGFLTDEEYDVLDASDQEFLDANSSPMAVSLFSVPFVVVAVLGPLLCNRVNHQLTVFGVYRSPIFASSSHRIHTISDTLQCEDIHYYTPGNIIFAACEDSVLPRFKWFPPLGHLDTSPETTGSIHIIDPRSLQSSRLHFENFRGPFITHGIDVIQDPEQSNAVYVFAVNHLANPEYRSELKSEATPKFRSQIEIFHHVLNASTIRHVRSVRHPLVKTPNDLYATSPYSFYATNDHYYLNGFMRHVEDSGLFTRWTDVVHVQLDRLTTGNETAGVNASVALKDLLAANGLGHCQSDDEILVSSSLGGIVWRTQANDLGALSIRDQISVDSTIDNPSYYQDPYKTADDDVSGYVLAGLRRAIDLRKTHRDPEGQDGVIVWYVRRNQTSESETGTGAGWEKRVIFEDDGSNIRSASAAVLVPIEPGKGESKEATLFVTGFISRGIIAVKVDLRPNL